MWGHAKLVSFYFLFFFVITFVFEIVDLFLTVTLVGWVVTKCITILRIWISFLTLSLTSINSRPWFTGPFSDINICIGTSLIKTCILTLYRVTLISITIIIIQNLNIVNCTVVLLVVYWISPRCAGYLDWTLRFALNKFSLSWRRWFWVIVWTTPSLSWNFVVLALQISLVVVEGRMIIVLAFFTNHLYVFGQHSCGWRIVVRFSISHNSTFHVDMLF